MEQVHIQQDYEHTKQNMLRWNPHLELNINVFYIFNKQIWMYSTS